MAKASVVTRSSRPQWSFALAAVPAAFVDLITTTSAAIFITILASSLSYGAELFPFEPPTTTRERMMEQRSVTTPQLSAEDRDKISKLAAQAKQLSSSDQTKLKKRLRESLDSAAKKGDLNQVKYFNEALRQLD